MSEKTSVVVTGVGATTPLGGDVPSTWDALVRGVSGARLLPYEWVERFDLPVKIGATLAVEPDQVLTRQEVKRNDRSSQMSLVAAREAWADASRDAALEVDRERLGVVVASGIGGVTTLLDAYDTLLEKGARRVLPLTVPMLMPNGPAASVGLELGARAGVHTTVSACASGAEAIGYAVEMIRTGRADVVVAGGTEAAIHPLPVSGFAAMRAMSTRNDEPERASRPYDKARDGFVLGEGAGIVVLESEEHARARGAQAYARIAGVGLTSDGYHITAPEPEGAHVARAIGFALQDAGLTASDIVHINAHATSTPVGDMAEIAALQAALGSAASGVAVSATKSMTGHTLGAAGAIESIATILALKHRLAPPTINLDDPDDGLTLDVVRVDARPLPQGQIAALNNSFGFGGHNVVLALTSV
ncbi:3-oxoacyl-[acyl-carrier-protein] synthase II [Motilibacter rhizosphaerae]|uniref:3-oxoacyl-[acyl-carrier-protein] synthase 2 n=1 Tax=Motilibacter rhizosphaerae TaxID=598652 RepID=A0A4Q7NRK0_9ACTN|nr:beta-ketoacyl-ACP synthase II [Motilibacter rhizosphaerae]RZS89671.1 3-oxoacyl-[acyl-carrier-protein] synthase II [Motilibacter rhizosphaerae]